MADPWRVPDNVVPICPECQAHLAFVCSWPSPGVWGYDVVRTSECPAHGPIFIGPETRVHAESAERQPEPPDDGDRDSRAPAQLKPKPVLNADAVAVPESDPGPNSN